MTKSKPSTTPPNRQFFSQTIKVLFLGQRFQIVPKALVVLQNGFVGRGHFATNQKIIQRVFRQDKVAMQSNVDFLKINPQLFKPEPVKSLSVSLERAYRGITANKYIVGH
ncbi:MAG: hypothetical protein VW622_05535 [Opitutae bacterium]